ncbi:hypothetical protein ACWDE9_28600 [Streptomyces olivaceoviridis]|uniref:hypothetical protein n=1 Tax=Streptomyces olivaceoviridis TaxID=1921 RepID=UPI001677DC12|nr:hypothetical protein [Streptomyces olivaceoviridis]GGZ29253.1 hypothetical protein GCM10010300_85230 [Streptomyces olivaceoviridis]
MTYTAGRPCVSHRVCGPRNAIRIDWSKDLHAPVRRDFDREDYVKNNGLTRRYWAPAGRR